MSVHTPGPWSLHSRFPEYVVPASHADRKVGGATDSAIDRDTYAQYVCRLEREHRHRPAYEQEGNARLIAAAPELFDALLELTHWHEQMREALTPTREFKPGATALRKVAYELSLNKARASIAKAEGK